MTEKICKIDPTLYYCVVYAPMTGYYTRGSEPGRWESRVTWVESTPTQVIYLETADKRDLIDCLRPMWQDKIQIAWKTLGTAMTRWKVQFQSQSQK